MSLVAQIQTQEPCTSDARGISCGPYQLTSQMLSTSDIDLGERFRKDYNDGGELENSIKEHGILQSLLVMERPNQKYLLLAGGRRFVTATKLGLEQVPVLVAKRELDELDIRTIELIENCHRRQLSYAEDVALKKEINELQIKKYGKKLRGGSGSPDSKAGWSPADTAVLLGVDRSTIVKDIKLANAIEKFPELANCKDKKEAAKVLEAMIKNVVREDQAKKIEAENLKRGEENLKTRLCNSYIVGDFFERVLEIPNNCFDFVEIDPFYGIELIDLYKAKGGGSSHLKENYQDVPPEIYVWYITETMKQCHRVMAENSWGICWFAMEPWFEPTYQAIINAGFFCRRVPGFWIQPTGAAYNPNLLLASAVDSFFYFRKGKLPLNTPGHLNTYHYNQVASTRKIHPTERPVELYTDILTTFTKPGAKMLVPFVGSGNQLLAASNLQINAVGFDLCQDYKNGFTIRVNEGDYGHYKSYK